MRASRSAFSVLARVLAASGSGASECGSAVAGGGSAIRHWVRGSLQFVDAFLEPLDGVDETRGGLLDAVHGNHLRVPGGEGGRHETRAQCLTRELRDQGLGAAVHDPQQEHHEEKHSYESKAGKNGDRNKRGTLRKSHGLHLVFPLRRDRLFDAIQPRFDLFAVAFRGSLGVLAGLFHPARGSRRVLPRLLDAHEHGSLLLLELLIRLRDMLGPFDAAFGRLILSRGQRIGFPRYGQAKCRVENSYHRENSRPFTISSHKLKTPLGTHRKRIVTGIQSENLLQPYFVAEFCKLTDGVPEAAVVDRRRAQIYSWPVVFLDKGDDQPCRKSHTSTENFCLSNAPPSVWRTVVFSLRTAFMKLCARMAGNPSRPTRISRGFFAASPPSNSWPLRSLPNTCGRLSKRA